MNVKYYRTIFGVFSLPFFFILSTIIIFFIVSLVGSRLAFYQQSLITFFIEIVFIFIGKRVAFPDMSWQEALVLYKPRTRDLFTGFTVGLFAYFLMNILVVFLVTVFNLSLGSSDTSTSIINTVGWERILVMFFLTPIVAPIFEELMFRGVILNALLKGATVKWGAVKHVIFSVSVSSLTFSALHFQGLDNAMDVFVLVWIFIVSLINSALLIKYKSVFVPMLSHIGYNGITLLLPLLLS